MYMDISKNSSAKYTTNFKARDEMKKKLATYKAPEHEVMEGRCFSCGFDNKCTDCGNLIKILGACSFDGKIVLCKECHFKSIDKL